MKKVRPWCGQLSDRGQLRNRNIDKGDCNTVHKFLTKQYMLFLKQRLYAITLTLSFKPARFYHLLQYVEINII